MKDIDFDELDKAVNSLMSGGSTNTTIPPRSESQVVTQVEPPASVPQTELAADKLENNPAPEEPVTVQVVPRPAPVMPAARRGGRFMDMVNKPTAKPSAPLSASREGLSINPRPSVEKPPIPVDTDTSTIPSQADMPDPIAVANAKQHDEIDASQPRTQSYAPVETPASLESPFIADAKVNKRPLNSNAASLDTSSEEPIFDIDIEIDRAEHFSKSDSRDVDEPPINPQIPELDSDLVAIESSEKIEAAVVTQAVETSDAAINAKEPSVPLGAASISPQYTPKQSSGDQSHAAIYDASQYPEPVAHPAKKKAGWLWVVWVVLLLGVGAAGAVILYNLGII